MVRINFCYLGGHKLSEKNMNSFKSKRWFQTAEIKIDPSNQHSLLSNLCDQK